MLRRWTTIILLTALGGCSYFSDTGQYSVYFQPYGAELDQPAIGTIQTAAHFARTHPLLPVTVVGYAAQPEPGQNVDRLSQQRADIVERALVGDGVPAARITTAANGATDPKSLPNLAVRRVDINVGK